MNAIDPRVALAEISRLMLRVAKKYDLHPNRVQVVFGTLSQGDTLVTIEMRVPPADKRKHRDETIRGSGDTLPEAEHALALAWQAHLEYELQEKQAAKRRREAKAARR